MINTERTLYKLSSAFRGGHVFERIVVALAKIKANRPLDAGDEEALREAAAFLQRAKQGSEWLNSPEVSSASKSWASSLEIAARSLGPERSFNDLESLAISAEKLMHHKRLRDKELGAITRFFENAFRGAVEEIDQALYPSFRSVGAQLETSCI